MVDQFERLEVEPAFRLLNNDATAAVFRCFLKLYIFLYGQWTEGFHIPYAVPESINRNNPIAEYMVMDSFILQFGGQFMLGDGVYFRKVLFK